MTRIALVTGASRGIGAATARLLATKGYAVCVNFRTESAFADQVVADIEAAGGRALAVQADVALAEDVARLFETVDTSLGVLDLLVNNAAIMSPRQRVDQIPIEEIERVLQVNVIGLIACAQQAVRRMSTHDGGKGGCIVNVSSGAAQQGNPNRGVPYAVSKGAVNSFSTGLSQEVAAEGIRVNTVSPGPIRTDMPGEEALARAAQVVPMGRAGEPEEIAEAIAWLASDEAGFVAGANLRVAGGRI
jgi:NAD(P)-dependent dehydrogenase (short-subunit alcohol dehydrogenase family)